MNTNFSDPLPFFERLNKNVKNLGWSGGRGGGAISLKFIRGNQTPNGEGRENTKAVPLEATQLVAVRWLITKRYSTQERHREASERRYFVR